MQADQLLVLALAVGFLILVAATILRLRDFDHYIDRKFDLPVNSWFVVVGFLGILGFLISVFYTLTNTPTNMLGSIVIIGTGSLVGAVLAWRLYSNPSLEFPPGASKRLTELREGVRSLPGILLDAARRHPWKIRTLTAMAAVYLALVLVPPPFLPLPWRYRVVAGGATFDTWTGRLWIPTETGYIPAGSRGH